MMKFCSRCGLDMPNWETHAICDACDQELYDEQTAEIEKQRAEAADEAYEKWCYDQRQKEE